MPDFAPSASVQDPTGFKESAYRPRRKIIYQPGTKSDKNNNSLQKKPNQYNPKDASKKIEMDEVKDAPSAFPTLLGYDPYSPPSMTQPNPKDFQPSKLVSRTVPEKRNTLSKPKRLRKPAAILRPPKQHQARDRMESKTVYSTLTTQTPQKQQATKPKTQIPKLAYDLDSGKIFDEEKEIWYKLVPSASD